MVERYDASKRCWELDVFIGPLYTMIGREFIYKIMILHLMWFLGKILNSINLILIGVLLPSFFQEYILGPWMNVENAVINPPPTSIC